MEMALRFRRHSQLYVRPRFPFPGKTASVVLQDQPAVAPAPGQPPVPPAEPAVRVSTDDEVDSMVVRMKQQSFDSDRLALGKVIVASANLTAAHIARLAKTIDFSQTQVEFLKYAYAYCMDKPNYHQAVEVLTFSSDKKKVLDYIATQR